MTGRRRNLLKATCFSLSLTGAAAVAAIALTPDLAFAKNAKSESASSNSQGSTHKGANSRGSKPDNSGRGHSGTAGQNSNSQKHLMGDHPSKLGALNAAHANENAFLNASPNSRVGLVAQYRDVVRDGQLLKADRDAAADELAALTPPARPSDEVEVDRVAANTKLTETNDELTQLELDIAAQEQADLGDGLTEDSDATLALKDKRDTLTGTKTSLEGEIADLTTEYDDAVVYETAEANLKDLEEQVEGQTALETETLEAAANKPVTPEVEAAVKVLLGLE